MTEFRPSGFQILPTIIKNLIIINGLVYLAEKIPFDNINLIDTFALHSIVSPLFKPWQLITHLFMHASFFHIFFNMLALWMFGSVLENLWGPKRFLTFYIISGLGAAFCHLMVLYYENNQLLQQVAIMTPDQRAYYGEAVARTINEPTVGASGAVYGCLVGFGYLFPNAMLIGFPFFFPIKAKYAVIMYIAVELFAGFQNSAGDNVAHFAHLGGALAGFLMVYFWNKNNRKTFY